MSGKFNSIECKLWTENNRCKECKKLIAGLIKKFPRIYQFCNGDLNKFVSLLRKVFILIKIWITGENLVKPHYHINLNLENINDEDYAHVQKVWEVFEIKNLGEYHDLYVQSDTLLLADVFENFRN